MAKKSLGYVELEWECPNCGSRNPGRVKVCQNCGTPQPEDVQFIQPAEEKIIEDAEVIARAKVGPDIHCAYCGTRNPADAEVCSRCGADLTEGTARRAGQVLGAHRDKPADALTCSYCGSSNPPSASQCWNCGANLSLPEPEPAPAQAAPARQRSGISPLLLGGIGLIIVAACIGLFIFLNQTDDVQGQVSERTWERSLIIMGMAPVEREDWWDEIPGRAEVGACRPEQRYTSDVPQPNSREVCGTPYTIDTGSGFGEVVQDCEYLVFEDRCQYTVMELQPINTLIERGSGESPQWPVANLEPDQEEGERDETYRITFSADGETYTYVTSNLEMYRRLAPGSRWTLKVNPLGGITDVEPVQ